MRWFLGLLLAIALIGGALYGVGRFLLPNTLEVTRTVEVARPRAALFAMIHDLRIAKEWSPYYARDPDAEFAISEQPGPGQTMRWVSNVREVGRGRMSIVESADYESVDALLQKGDAIFDSRISLARATNGTEVTWRITAECGGGWINIPCRYINQFMLQSMVGAELDRGLTRLKDLAEQLPNVDFEGLDVAELPVESMDVIFVDLTLASDRAPTFEDRAAAEADGIVVLNNFVASTNGSVSPLNRVVRVFPASSGANGRYTFSVGYPFEGPAPVRLVGVRVGQTPSGAALRVEYVGRRSQIAVMYQRIQAYMQAHRITPRPSSEAWEIVHESTPAAPDSAHPNDPIERTEIFYPIE